MVVDDLIKTAVSTKAYRGLLEPMYGWHLSVFGLATVYAKDFYPGCRELKLRVP